MDTRVIGFDSQALDGPQQIRWAAQQVQEMANDSRVVVTTAAASRDLTSLNSQATRVARQPTGPALDLLLASAGQKAASLLALALQDLGTEAVPFSSSESGIITSTGGRHIRIAHVEIHQLNTALASGKIPVLNALAGHDRQGQFTGPGPGGFCVTPVALSAALQASRCTLYTRPGGVYTAARERVPRARCLELVSYDEMLEIAWQGEAPLHPRSLEMAFRHGVSLELVDCRTGRRGTIIEGVSKLETGRVVTAITHRDKLTRFTLQGVADQPGIAAQIFERLAPAGVRPHMIAQSSGRAGRNDISFCVAAGDEQLAMEAATAICDNLGAQSVQSQQQVAKVSVIGVGLAADPTILARTFATIGQQDTNIEMISTAGTSINCLIARRDLDRVLRALHDEFRLHQLPASEELLP